MIDRDTTPQVEAQFLSSSLYAFQNNTRSACRVKYVLYNNPSTVREGLVDEQHIRAHTPSKKKKSTEAF